ncbi:hypothetical protein EES43_16125 [Streptomyces sp. ADI96-02]|uniref:hypothetical protein n=1 Tax=unclassified Streptomyces TaxID=2593676 RepID=UPI000F555D68|nr:hypothetical protein [Streptomyces sp. ADI96-02]RPK61352.1 hypothetical protein EES43_16125 [Streptomyces sp. ADI96-02]
MSTATANPRRTGPAHGATAVTGHHRPHRVGDALRAVKVFVTTAFGVVVMGEYAGEPVVARRTR